MCVCVCVCACVCVCVCVFVPCACEHVHGARAHVYACMRTSVPCQGHHLCCWRQTPAPHRPRLQTWQEPAPGDTAWHRRAEGRSQTRPTRNQICGRCRRTTTTRGGGHRSSGAALTQAARAVPPPPRAAANVCVCVCLCVCVCVCLSLSLSVCVDNMLPRAADQNRAVRMSLYVCACLRAYVCLYQSVSQYIKIQTVLMCIYASKYAHVDT